MLQETMSQEAGLTDTVREVGRRGPVRHLAYLRPLVHYLVRPSFRSFRAFLHDLSASGIGLLCNGPLEPGTMLAIQLKSPEWELPLIVRAQVIHATQGADKSWRVGCALYGNLRSHEVAALLLE